MGVPPGGSTPASAFTANALTPTSEAPAILADRIDPVTGDFEDLLSGRDPTDAAVQVAFATERGSGAAALRHGHRFKTLRQMNEVSLPAVESLAEEAVKSLLDAGDVRLSEVHLELENGSPSKGEGAETTVEFENLRTGKPIRQNVDSRERL